MKKSLINRWLIGSLVIFFLMSTTALSAQKLRLLVWEGYAPKQQVKKFERYIAKKYDKTVKLEVTYISDPNDFFNKVRKMKADLISPTHNLIKDYRFNFIKKGLLLPVDLSRVPNYKNLLPALQKAEYFTENGKVYGVPLVHGPYGLAYNTVRINEPESWNILWDPKFKGKYTLSEDYYEVNIYITALSLGYKVNQLNDFSSLNVPVFKNKLNQLAGNAARLWKGVDKPEDLKGLTLAGVWGFSLPDLKKQGEIWKIAEPREGTMGFVDNYAIGYSLKNKPFLRQVAEEWLNFVIGIDFQLDTVVKALGSSPVNVKVKNKLSSSEVKRLHLDDPDYFQYNRILWPTLKTKRDRNGMKMLWQRALRERK